MCFTAVLVFAYIRICMGTVLSIISWGVNCPLFHRRVSNLDVESGLMSRNAALENQQKKVCG